LRGFLAPRIAFSKFITAIFSILIILPSSKALLRPNHLTPLLYHILLTLSNEFPLFFIFVKAVITAVAIDSNLHNFRYVRRLGFLRQIILTASAWRDKIISRGKGGGRGDYREEEEEERRKIEI
jgi:hypothetical protein